MRNPARRYKHVPPMAGTGEVQQRLNGIIFWCLEQQKQLSPRQSTTSNHSDLSSTAPA